MVKKCLKIGLVSAFLAGTFLVPLPAPQYAQSAGGFIPFGGVIQYARVCTCSAPNWGIRVGPPVAGNFIYQSRGLFREYQIFRPGPWVVGIASGYAPCMQVRGNSCVADEQVPGGPVIMLVGTSF